MAEEGSELQKLLTSRWQQHNVGAAPPSQLLSGGTDRCFILRLRRN